MVNEEGAGAQGDRERDREKDLKSTLTHAHARTHKHTHTLLTIGLGVGVLGGKVGVLVTSTVLSGVLEGWMTSGLSALGVVVGMSGVMVLGMTGSEGDGWIVKVGDDMSTTWPTHSTMSMVPGTQLLTQI